MCTSKILKYKDLDSDDCNSFDYLSMQVLSTINYMFSLPGYYEKYKKMIGDKYLNTLNAAFNDIKSMLWLRFTNQIREYSTIIYKLLKSNADLYNDVDAFIKGTKFLKPFIDGKDKYDALSLTLHNFSKIEYGKEKYTKCFNIYDEHFNEALLNNDMKKIKEEFQTIISLFRKIDGYECVILDLGFSEYSIIFELIDLIIKVTKKN